MHDDRTRLHAAHDPDVPRVFLGTADPEMRRVVDQTLGNARFAMLHASDARGAFRVLLADRPDVVVLDAHLADISGIEVARAVRSSPHADEVATVLLARDVTGTALAIADDGVRIVAKPLDVLALTDLIRAHLHARRTSESAPLHAIAQTPRVATPPPTLTAPEPATPRSTRPPSIRPPCAATWALLGVAEGAVAAEVLRAADALMVNLAQRSRAARSQDERSAVSATAARIRAARTEVLAFLSAPASDGPMRG